MPRKAGNRIKNAKGVRWYTQTRLRPAKEATSNPGYKLIPNSSRRPMVSIPFVPINAMKAKASDTPPRFVARLLKARRIRFDRIGSEYAKDPASNAPAADASSAVSNDNPKLFRNPRR